MLARASLFCSLLAGLLFHAPTATHGENSPAEYDVFVYGATSGGVAAAIQARRMGKSAVLIEPGRHIGGLTSGGLGATDIGNKRAIGGISREFYRRIGEHYARPESWTRQSRESYRSGRQQSGEVEMWTFEPHVAENLFRDMLREAGVTVVLERALDRKAGVLKSNGRITQITMVGGQTFRGRMFIDATYEGDLMAAAGVSYHVGREANATYNETLNGVQTRHATKHQFKVPVDPYITPGDPASGLLPGIHTGPPGNDGDGDQRVQAYNFRMCLTDAPENRIPFPKPAEYDPLRYELLLRYIQGGVFDAFCSNLPMPNRKTDTNNCGAFSTDNIGMNYDYPEADYAARERIFHDHVVYQQGLMWFLASDPRVPANIRREIGRWGLCKDEFQQTGGWPHQLYVREARRLISDYVMTQHHCQGRAVAEDSVGLAAYTMDSHNTQRYVKDGKAINEGDVQVGGFSPYPISYRSLVPKGSECDNLFVPVCLAASHIAYGSIRMEPVFMVLGQSSATAASLAIDAGIPVQKVDYAVLKARLLADKQVLAWTGPVRQGARDPNKLAGVVVDDTHAELTGGWDHSASVDGFVGAGYLHDANAGKGEKSARFAARLPKPGRYEVRIYYTANPNRATNVPVVIVTASGEKSAVINQRQKPKGDGFTALGQFEFTDRAVVTIFNKSTDGHVVVDAVQFVPASN
jgi:hypothetical protein